MYIVYLKVNVRIYIYIFSYIYPIIFYGWGLRNSYILFPYCLLRILAGLYCGTVIYVLSEQLRQRKVTVFETKIITFLKVFLFLIPVVLCYFNSQHFHLMVLCFIGFLTIIFSNKSYFPNIKNEKLVQLIHWGGKEFSMGFYLTHGVALRVVEHYFNEIEFSIRCILALIIAILLYYGEYYIVNFMIKFLSKKSYNY